MMAPALSILPLVKSLPDCADFWITVAPYQAQLYALPYRLAERITDLEGLKNVYLATNPLVFAFAFSLALAPLFLVISEINRNYSQVDRVWSILPAVYAIHYAAWAHMSELPSKRVDNVLACAVIWSMRLTFNYWRKGGYTIGSEDYRWEIIREKTNPALFFLFNVTFISTIQSILLFSVTAPIYLLLLSSRYGEDVMTTYDHAFARGIIALIAISAVADQQQWNYYAAREQYRKTAKVPPKYKREDLERGFNVRGLFSLSRHPNFAAEQGIWVTFYAWSCYTTQTYINWTGAGALSYLILFQGSTWFTEMVSTNKYPDYATYSKRVGRFVPWPTALFTQPMPSDSGSNGSTTRSTTKKR